MLKRWIINILPKMPCSSVRVFLPAYIIVFVSAIIFLAGAEGRLCPLAVTRKNRRACAYPWFFRPLRQHTLPSPATGSGRVCCPARGFGAKSTLSVKPRVKIQSPHKIRIKTALSGFESAVRFCHYSFCWKLMLFWCSWKSRSTITQI